MWVTGSDAKRSTAKPRRSDTQKATTMETVWRILENGKWEPKAALLEATGVSDETLTNVINFLTRWNFVEIERYPELRIRRKRGAISPMKTLEVLRGITDTESSPKTGRKLVERLSCRVCNGRELNFVGVNEVECNRCYEKQWYSVEAPEPLSSTPIETEAPVELSVGGRLLVRLGRPQKAFQASIPKSTQYFWFRCTSCGKTSTDYAHGHTKISNLPTMPNTQPILIESQPTARCKSLQV